MGRARRDDQVSYSSTAGPPRRPADPPALEVDVLDLGQHHRRAGVVPQHPPQRRGDLAGRESARGHLVEQRLERWKFRRSTSQVRGRVAEVLGGLEPAEAPAHHDHPVRSPLAHRRDATGAARSRDLAERHGPPAHRDLRGPCASPAPRRLAAIGAQGEEDIRVGGRTCAGSFAQRPANGSSAGWCSPTEAAASSRRPAPRGRGRRARPPPRWRSSGGAPTDLVAAGDGAPGQGGRLARQVGALGERGRPRAQASSRTRTAARRSSTASRLRRDSRRSPRPTAQAAPRPARARIRGRVAMALTRRGRGRPGSAIARSTRSATAPTRAARSPGGLGGAQRAHRRDAAPGADTTSVSVIPAARASRRA